MFRIRVGSHRPRFQRGAALGIALAILAGVYTPTAGTAQAESCEAHLAKHGTNREVDIAYHIDNGGESPCGYELKQEASNNRSESSPVYTENKSESSNYDESKSRYCRKRWFC